MAGKHAVPLDIMLTGKGVRPTCTGEDAGRLKAPCLADDGQEEEMDGARSQVSGES